MSNKKGMAALHSVSDGVVEALRTLRPIENHALSAEPLSEPGFPTGGALSHEEVIAQVEAEVQAEQSKPIDRAAPLAPSLLVTGSEAILRAGEATEAERVREYGLLAEIDNKLTETAAQKQELALQFNDASDAASRAQRGLDAAEQSAAELEAQRAETVDRILKLNQMTIDNEAARLRRGQ